MRAAADDVGASSTSDGEFSAEEAATAAARKLFGIHAGEADANEINPALDLDPDFLIQTVYAERLHLERLADSGTLVVVCSRSNAVTDVGLPPVRELLDRTTVALGTDNVMLDGPSMFREMACTAELTDASDREALAMARKHGAEIAGLDCGVIAAGREARLLVLDGDSDNLAHGLSATTT